MPNVDGLNSVDDLKNALGKMTKELTWVLNHLDTRNMNYIDGDLLVEGTVTALKLQVDELSAITANLGHITAGLIESIEIYGSYIATRRNAFPRSEMSNADHLFAALTDENNHVKIRPDLSGAPGVRFTSAGYVLGSLNSYQGFLEIWGSAILALTAPKVQFGNWYNLFNKEDGSTLGDELDNIWEAINSKANINHAHSVSIPNHNHGNPANANSGGGTYIVS
jgi:hypothetical protein